MRGSPQACGLGGANNTLPYTKRTLLRSGKWTLVTGWILWHEIRMEKMNNESWNMGR
jgi:hypothetical protein